VTLQKCEAPIAARTAAIGASVPKLEGSGNDRNDTKRPPHVKEAIADLRREFIAECLRVAAVKAAHCADNICLRDDLTAERDIRIAVENIREATRGFRALSSLETGDES
jgi:hypothetical protein